MLQKLAAEIGAIGLNSTPYFGTSFSCGSTTSNVVDCLRDPTGELTVLPRLFSWNKGELLLRKGDGAERGRKDRGESREIGKERTGRKGRGKEWRAPVCIFKFFLE